jgi:tight adherence protein B
MKIILIGVLAFTAVAVLEAFAYTLRYLKDRKRDELKRRLTALGTTELGGSAVAGLLRRGKLANSASIDSLLRSIKLTARLENLLEQTELEMTVAGLLSYMGAGAFMGLVLGLLSQGPIMTLILTVLFAWLPMMYVLFKRSQRSRRLSEQLPDALEMMARSLRAGHALSSAFKLVAAEMPEPVNVEFGRAFEAQELGMAFEKAVGDMTRRAPNNQDLKIFALSVIVQKETGGNLVEIIEKIAETVRNRYKFQGKLRALTAEGRMSSYVVGVLPWGSLLLSMASNPEYAMLLFKTQVGHYVLGYAVISWSLGFLIMKKMMKVTI